MKCWFHPKQDAVTFCKSCGKGVCQDCLVAFGGDSYCKDCIEHGKVAAVVPSLKPTVAERVPVPKGKPSRAFFVVGGVGCIVNTVAAIWFFLLKLDIFSLPFLGLSSWVIGYILLAIGLILASIGYFGMRRNYDSRIGLAGFVVGIITSVLFLLWTVWDYIAVFPINGSWMLVVYFEVTIYNIFFIMMILWGITHIITRRFTGRSGLSFATGIMLIMTAIFLEIFDMLLAFFLMGRFYGYPTGVLNWALEIFDLIWAFLFFVSEILATVLFFTAKVSESSVKPSY